MIKYYTTSRNNHENIQIGDGLRGIFDLTGGKIDSLCMENPYQISIRTPQDRTTEIILETESIEEVSICLVPRDDIL